MPQDQQDQPQATVDGLLTWWRLLDRPDATRIAGPDASLEQVMGAVADMHALAASPAPATAVGAAKPLSDVECWEQGKPDSIDRAMEAEILALRMTPDEIHTRDWWCPHCLKDVPPEMVTKDGEHYLESGGCGRALRGSLKDAAEVGAAKLEPDASKVVVTKNEAGQIVAVTRQDLEGRIISVIAESALPAPAQEVTEPSGETIAQREEVCAAWAALPDDLRKDSRLTRLYRALGGPRMDMPEEAAEALAATHHEDGRDAVPTVGVKGTSDWQDEAMKLAENYARAWQHDMDGNYVVKEQAVKAKEKLRAHLAGVGAEAPFDAALSESKPASSISDSGGVVGGKGGA